MKNRFCLYFLLFLLELNAQSYTSYFTGNTEDVTPQAIGGVCLMGGATENDNAMRWFLQRASGGDVVVVRASGSDGYNDYFFTDLGIAVNSVETIVFNSATASNDTYVQTQIANAEAIWIAGGDQWDYVTYWKDSPIEEIINNAIRTKNIVIGGTSAGMAILGSIYFDAQNGSATSTQALQNPYHNNVTLGKNDFLEVPHLRHVITDTHYDNPDRRARQTTFLARALTDWGIEARGIACEEYTAVCIALNGTAQVFGDYPNYDDFAYFLQVNCTIPNPPERCEANRSLEWNKEEAALKVYKVAGTQNGSNMFNLFDWKTGSGGVWQNWWVQDGVFSTSNITSPSCNSVELSTKVFLEGAYDNGTSLMMDGLRTIKALPLLEPYYAIGDLAKESDAMITPELLTQTGDDAIVDWVLIELRDKNDSTKVLAQKAALLQCDGDVVDVDGVSSVRFQVIADEYFVAVHHRNHLAIMTANPLFLE